MRPTVLIVALCVGALVLPACNRKARARQGVESAETTLAAADAARAGMIETVSVALHTGAEPKAVSDSVVVLLFRGADVIGERTVGGGEHWNLSFTRALEIPLRPPLSVAEASNLRLEIVKTGPTGLPGFAWVVQAEALGQLSDGRVIRLLELTPGVTIGGDQPSRQSWPLSAQ